MRAEGSTFSRSAERPTVRPAERTRRGRVVTVSAGLVAIGGFAALLLAGPYVGGDVDILGLPDAVVHTIAHLTVWPAIAVALWLALGRRFTLAWLLANALAAAEEWRQRTVPGRIASVDDALINLAGITTALVVVWLIARVAGWKTGGRSEGKTPSNGESAPEARPLGPALRFDPRYPRYPSHPSAEDSPPSHPSASPRKRGHRPITSHAWWRAPFRLSWTPWGNRFNSTERHPMWNKVVWLSFWVTMILWLGNFWGCAKPGQEQNYRMLEDEQRTPVQRENSSAAPAERDTQFVLYQDENTISDANDNVDVVPPDVVVRLEQPVYLRGIDRSHWPRIETGPEIAVTWHYPVYFKDWMPQHPAVERVNFNDPIAEQWADALAHPFAQNWDAHNALQLVIQPLKAAFDLVAAPFHMVTGAPPWLKVPSHPDSTQRFAYPID